MLNNNSRQKGGNSWNCGSKGLTAALCLENWDKLERLYEGDETILKEVYQNED